MAVRAKFRVDSVGQQDGADYTSVYLSPVTSGSEENKSFWRATPAGQIQMSITNPDAAAFFTTGAEVYVDFTPATAA